MEHGSELLTMALAVVLFCGAVTWLFLLNKNYNEALQVSGNRLTESVMFEQYQETVEDTYTRGEILSMMLAPLEYDMEINGQFLSKNDNVKAEIGNYILPDTVYEKSYAYDSKGAITRVIFTSD